MDTHFVFPRPQAPAPRPTRALSSTPTTEFTDSRNSNALRASVLDAALQLGIGNNSLVAEWMFNSVAEDDEEEQISSPSLTNGSSATSDESFSSSPPFLSNPSSSSHLFTRNPHDAGNFSAIAFAEEKRDNGSAPSFITQDSRDVVSPTPTPTLRPMTPVSSRGKLRKKRGDGYESDGGYLSEAGNKRDKKEKEKKKKDAAAVNGADVAKAAKALAKEEKLLQKQQKEEDRKRKKELALAAKPSKKSQEKNVLYATGYETDGGASFKKAKSKKLKPRTADGEVGYETDAGYLSSTPASVKKSKTRFFRIGGKSSKHDLQKEMPSEKEKEREFVLPLPIAEQFSTTLFSALNSPKDEDTRDTSDRTGSTLSAPGSSTVNVPSRVTSPLPSSPSLVPPSSYVPPTRSSDTSSTGSIRDSHISSTSSSSSSSKRKGFRYSLTSIANGLATIPAIRARSPSPTPSSVHNSPTKFPAISYPITRSSSPSPAATVAPLQITKTNPANNLIVIPNAQYPQPMASSPSPNLSPNSPYITVIPVSSNTPPPPRPRFPPTDGFGPRPNGAATGLTPSPSPRKDVFGRPSPITIVPTSDYIVPSARNSALHSPNVLAYYDIPPPSPPPAGPLPSVPNGGRGSPAFPLRAQLQERNAVSKPVREAGVGVSGQPIPAIQRGKETPFPSRPVLPAVVGGNSSSGGLGLEARVKVPRYRELYAIGGPHGGWNTNDIKDEWPREMHASRRRRPKSWVEDEEEEEEEEDMRDVLERFEDTSSEGHEDGKALESRRSFEALKDYDGGNGPIPRLRKNRKSDEEDGELRSTMYSVGSIYSRASILDTEKSEETRERFLQRVEAMLESEGRGHGRGWGGPSAIPPVPKLPEGLMGAGAAPGKSWNMF